MALYFRYKIDDHTTESAREMLIRHGYAPEVGYPGNRRKDSNFVHFMNIDGETQAYVCITPLDRIPKTPISRDQIPQEFFELVRILKLTEILRDPILAKGERTPQRVQLEHLIAS